MMKTCLVNIPQDNTKTAQAFEDVFVQLHEALRGSSVSFEILARGQTIAFCFTAEPSIAEVVAGQIYAIAPDAYIQEIKDFTRNFGNDVQFVSSEVHLNRPDLFPLKDHRDFEGDSLSGLLSVLSKSVPGEMVVVQFVIKPCSDSWYHHLRLNARKRGDRFRQIFRIKYWFKRNVAGTFRERIQEKTSGRLYICNIRVGALARGKQTDPNVKLQALIGALSNFNTLDFNQLRFAKVRRFIGLSDFQRRKLHKGFLLSTRELSTMFHLPSEKEVPNLVHVLSKKEAPPTNLPTNQSDPDVSFFGSTNFRGQQVPFGIKTADRRRHLYVVGKSGSGKSKMLELLIRNDLIHGRGVGVLDPHGDLVDNVLAYVPKDRVKDVIIFDPSDLNFPPAFNPLEKVPEALKMRVTIGFIEIFKKLFGTNWSPRLEHVLRYTTLALLDSPNTTVLSILKMLTDKNYRQSIVRNIQDNVVKNFWVNEFASWSEKFDNEAITPLLNKVGQFVATNMIRNIVGQPVNLFNFRDLMDSRKILLMKVSKGILGEENAGLLGAIVVTKVYQAAMSRADIPENKRVPFYFYVDEFHNFATDTFGEILSEARKYNLNLTIANQFLGQLDGHIRKTVFGNVGSVVSFRLGGEDAEIMASEFNPRFTARDVINLGVREFCVKMSIEGEIKEAFSGKTLTVDTPEENSVADCIEYSRQHYAKPLHEVQDILARWEEGDAAARGPARVVKHVAGGGAVAAPASAPSPDDFEEPLL
ncbi:MAG: type IV secretory system conjugative DNA transfer family protein [Deltaproteobacteria bacterium]|nr:type IV secretory system conjugative DNA transfer family protein [Deltaproteobacteria bacterium]